MANTKQTVHHSTGLVMPCLVELPQVNQWAFSPLRIRVYLQSVALQSIHKASEIVSNKNVVQFT